MRHYKVREWMTPSPITISPKSTLPEAYKHMKGMHVRRLPVVHNNQLVGIVTWGDVREASPSDATSLNIWEQNYLLSKLTVDQIMTSPVLTVSPEATVHEAARLMYRSKVSGLPVVERGRVVGILTESDILRMLVQEWDEEQSAHDELAEMVYEESMPS